MEFLCKNVIVSPLLGILSWAYKHESSGMLGFQNRAPDTKLMKIHTSRDAWAYLEKCDF